MIFKLMVLLLNVVGARIGSQTTFNGIVNPTQINRYLKIKQNTGFKFENMQPFFEKSSAKEYTMSVWFMLDEFPWIAGQDMVLVHFDNNNLKCMLFESKVIDCFQSETFLSMFSLDVSDLVQLNQWYLLVLRSINGMSYLSLYDEALTGPIAERQSSSFVPFLGMQPGRTFNVFLGVNKFVNSQGLIGAIRQLNIQTRYLASLGDILENAFHVQEGSDLKFQVLLHNSTKGLQDTVSGRQALVVSRNIPASLKPEIDFKSQFICSKGVNWDGVACKESLGNIVFQANSFVKSQFQFVDKQSEDQTVQIGKEYNELSVEFWIKPSTQSQRQQATMFTLAKNGETLMQITKGANSILKCFPMVNLYQYSEEFALEFSDFSEDSNPVWHHVSCTVDQKMKVLRGQLLKYKLDGTTEEFSYVKDIKEWIGEFSLQQKYRDDEFEVVVNSDAMQSRGMSNAMYAEVRVWNKARSVREVQNYRHQLVDYISEANDLLSVHQLLSRGNTRYDLGQINIGILTIENEQNTFTKLFKEVQVSSVSWQPDNSLVLCPLQTTFDPSDNTCKRDGIQELKVVTLKDEKYILTPFFSHFASNMISYELTRRYAFKWEVQEQFFVFEQNEKQRLREAVESQQNNPQLVLLLNEVTDRAQYKFRLTVVDTLYKQQQTFTHIVDLRVHKCMKFFDKATNSSEVTIKPDKARGLETISLQFEYEACASYSGFDPTLTFKFVQESMAPPNNYGVNLLGKELVITPYAQDFLPVNKPIQIVLTADWVNQIKLSLVYTVVFETKVVVKITPSNIVVAQDGRMLFLRTDKSQVVNYNSKSNPKFEIMWKCPPHLCLFPDQNPLALSHFDFERANVEFWQSVNITAVAKTNFIQGESSWESQDTVQIYYIPHEFNARIDGDSILSIDQPLSLELIANVDKSQVRFEWITFPYTDPKQYLNSNNRPLFAINPFYLKIGQIYDFTVKMFMNSTNLLLFEQTLSVEVFPAPVDGRLLVDPYQGTPLNSDFKIYAPDWVVRAPPALYQFLYEDVNGQMNALTEWTSQDFIITKLPATKKVQVLIIDQREFLVQRNASVFCPFGNGESGIERFYGGAKSNLNNNIGQLLQYSMLSNDIVQLSNFTQTHIDMSKQMIDTILNNLDQVQRHNPSQQLLMLELHFQIFSHLARKHNFTDIGTALRVEQRFIDYLAPDSFFARSLNKAPLKPSSVDKLAISSQSSFLNALVQKAYNQEFPNLSFGWKDKTLMNSTHYVRDVMYLVEQKIARNLKEGQNFTYEDSYIKVFGQNFKQDAPESLDDTVGDFQLLIPLNNSANRTLVYTVYKINPFVGTYYQTPRGERQQATLSQTLAVQWFYQNGTQMQDSQSVEFSAHYPFYREKLNQTYEYQITHCVHMVQGLNITSSQFIKDGCTTKFSYEENRITCNCKHQSLFTVTRDEFVIPLTDDMSFNFKNWASLVVFSYLTLLVIFGNFVASSLDQRDIAKMNDMESDAAEGIVQDMPVQFPLSAFALKRQVFLMNFADQPISVMRLFRVFLTQFHPILQIPYRFDPTLNRQDRFTLYYLQITLLAFLSFLLCRNVDKPAPETGKFTFTLEVLVMPTAYTFLLSLLVMGPLPTWVLDCLRTKFELTSIPEELDTLQSFDVFDADSIGLAEASLLVDEPLGEVLIEGAEKAPNQSSLVVDPTIPLKLLFQLSAFNLTYIIKKGQKRFKFLSNDRKVIAEEVGKAPVELKKKKVEDREERKEVRAERQAREERLKLAKKEEKRKRKLVREARKADQQSIHSGFGASQDPLFENSFVKEPTKVPEIQPTRRGDFLKRNNPVQSESSNSQNPLLNHQDISLQLEGGGADDQNSAASTNDDRDETKSDDMKNTNNEFVQLPSKSTGRIRLLLYTATIFLLMSMLVIYSQEEIHSSSGRSIWVFVFFGSQLVSAVLTCPIYILILSKLILGSSNNKQFWFRHYYELAVIVEDFWHVNNFLNQKFG